jgi:hypothetical protein
VVEEEGRTYTFKLEMLDGQSGAVLAQRENRCEICTDSEALEIANAAASALKAQAVKKPGAPAAPARGGVHGHSRTRRRSARARDRAGSAGAAREPGRVPRQAAHVAGGAGARARAGES